MPYLKCAVGSPLFNLSEMSRGICGEFYTFTKTPAWLLHRNNGILPQR
jgi:hypothetical protein